MDNIAGSPVEGQNFYGRRVELELFKELLEKHDILLLGPRRIGKTSLARALMATMRQQPSPWLAVEINVASCNNEYEFLGKLEDSLGKQLASLADRLLESIKTPFSTLAERIKRIQIAVAGAGSASIDLGSPQHEDWIRLGNDVLALIAQLESPWLIYVDELPIMLYNIIRNDPQTGVQRVRRFLDWFRNDVRALPGSHRVRWLVSGSVGLDTLVQQHGMSDTINSMTHRNLPPFTEAEARAMLETLATRYALSFGDAEIQAMLESIQWWQPYYLQKTFIEVRGLRGHNPEKPIHELLDAAIEQMIQPGSDNDFHFWEQRLFLQLPDRQARQAISMLTKASETREGVRPETLLETLQAGMGDVSNEEARERFKLLRDILLRDAYLMLDERDGNRRYRFVLEPLRCWWVRRNTL